MEFFLTGYYDPFTGSLMIQLVTVGLITVGASLRQWRDALQRYFFGAPKENEIRNE